MAKSVVDTLVALQEQFPTIIKEHLPSLEIAVVAICCLLFVYWFFIHPFIYFKLLGIPQVKPLIPPFGNLLQLAKGSPEIHLKLMKEYGKVYGLFFGTRPTIVIADAKVLQHVLVKSFAKFHNRPQFLQVNGPPMNLGLAFAEYKDWKRTRPFYTQTFTASKLKQMLPLIEESIDTLISIMSESSKNEQPVNVSRCYAGLTLEVVLSIAFGTKTDFLLNHDERITKAIAKWFRLDKMFILIDMLPLPLCLKNPIRQFLSKDPAFFVNLIKPVVEERKRVPSYRKDFLQLLLSESKADGKMKLSDDELYAQAITFLFGGYETTSNTLSYTTYLLALHPDIQQRLYEEILEKFNKDPDGSIYEDIQKMEYLDQVISESLRMYPPVPVGGRLTEADSDIDGYRIPKGVEVDFPVYAIHHFEEYWKNHDKFDPERFNAENKPKINQFHYLPFGFGPRNCVGMRFALIEAKLTLVKVLKKFEFVQIPETEVPLNLSFGCMMTPANGIKLKVVPRE